MRPGRVASLLVVVTATSLAAGPAKKKGTVTPVPKVTAPRASDAPTAAPASVAPAQPNRITEPSKPAMGHGTACASCHVTASWSQVLFNHEATGFALKNKHAQVGCKQCHATSFQTPLPRGCAGCHDDAHGGDLGQRCEGCHDERDWVSSFSVETHRRTNFPLLGGHAVLPCVECHVDARERRFTRPAVPCVQCHQAALARTSGTGVDHLRLAFGDHCLGCHSGIRFKPARFVTPLFTHDTCFFISAGPHAAVSCEQCHGAGVPALTSTCGARSATCTSCHAHECMGPGGGSQTDTLHRAVQGYQCRDAKCTECHSARAP